MNLYLLRHGLAVERGASDYAKDSERPLLPKGERKLWRIAEAMEALELKFDLILSSPYVRTRQTAEIVAEAFNARKKIQFSENLTPTGNAKELITQLIEQSPAPKSVLLVGHEPYLSRLISVLISGGSDAFITMKKGGLCRLETESLAYGRCASLIWLLTPKQMALMVGP